MREISWKKKISRKESILITMVLLYFIFLVQHINLVPKEIDNHTNKLIQDSFDFLNKDFYHLEPMLIPIWPETPSKINEMEI